MFCFRQKDVFCSEEFDACPLFRNTGAKTVRPRRDFRPNKWKKMQKLYSSAKFFSIPVICQNLRNPPEFCLPRTLFGVKTKVC